MSENGLPRKIEVVVDRHPEIVKEREEKEQLRKELEELKKKQFETRKKAVGCEDDSITTEAELDGWIKANEQNRANRPSPSGSAPMNPTVGGTSTVPKKGFSSYEEMYQHLIIQENKDRANGIENGNAKQVLDALFYKGFKDGKVPNVSNAVPFDSMLDYVNNLKRKEVKNNAVR